MTQAPKIFEQALPALEALSRFWSFQRKKLAAELRAHLNDAQSKFDGLYDTNQQLTEQCIEQKDAIRILQSQSQALAIQLQAETANLMSTSEALVQEQSKRQALMITLTESTSRITELEERHQRVLLQISELEGVIEDHKDQLLSKEQSVQLLENLTEQLKLSHQHLQNNYQDINQQHLSLTEKFELISAVLAQQPPRNDALTALTTLIDNDFMDFANRESSLADEAQAILAMQAILAEIRMVNNFPSIAGKTIVSIAGGFSSGKSAFVNSFIKGQDVQLATGINPVTVVPSYVVCADETRIKGYSYNGGSIHLKPSIYSAMSHEYVKAFGFDLRRILPFISVNVPMEVELFDNLCIIDTPGYNPGTFGGAAAADRATAASLIKQASALIWVIGLDPAGTITQSDIEFIQATPFRDSLLYIVLNKADVKSEDDIELIMQQVADDLYFAGIGFAGICAYSSTRKKEYAVSGQKLTEFLRSINHKVDIIGQIGNKIDDVFDKYERALQADLKQLEENARKFNDFKLDALEIGGTTLYDRVDEAFPISGQMLDSSELEQLLTECEDLRQKLKLAAQKSISLG